jgi:hypothetical protein
MRDRVTVDIQEISNCNFSIVFKLQSTIIPQFFLTFVYGSYIMNSTLHFCADM